MAHVTLSEPDIALFSDPAGSRVALPTLVDQSPDTATDSAAVLFEGDTAPTAFWGEPISSTWKLAATFGGDDQQGAADLIALFKAAHVSADRRLQLRTLALVEDLADLAVVTVSRWRQARGSAWTLTVEFEAQEVAYTLEV